MNIKPENVIKQKVKVGRKQREKILGHPSAVLWFTGLSGSGKSTLAINLEWELNRRGKSTYLLDGDNIRLGLNADLRFSEVDRVENLRRVSEVSRLFWDAGVIVLVSTISPFCRERERARKIIGKDFLEIYVKADLATCESRDPKGLYKKARTGEIKDFTGISSPYEEPRNAEIVIETQKHDLPVSLKLLVDELEKRGLA